MDIIHLGITGGAGGNARVRITEPVYADIRVSIKGGEPEDIMLTDSAGFYIATENGERIIIGETDTGDDRVRGSVLENNRYKVIYEEANDGGQNYTGA